MLNRYKVLLFDSDNTLFNHNAHEKLALAEAFAEYGEPLKEGVYELYHEINANCWKEFELGVIHPRGLFIERFDRLAKKTNASFDPERMNAIFTPALGRQSVPFEDSYEVCEKLSKTHTLYIITNGTHSIQLYRYERSPLRPFFSGIFTAESMGANKPKAEFFENVLRQIGNPPKSDCIVIGDSLTSDMQGGVNAGIDTCWFNPNALKNPYDFSVTYEIRSLRELLPR